MRIAHLSCVAPPETGGIGMVAAREVESLREHGHDAYQASLTTHAGFRIGNAGMIHALSHVLAETDIVHLHYPFYGATAQLVHLKRQGHIRRLVATLHMDAQAGGIKGRIFDIHRQLFQKRTLQAFDALIVSSRDYAEHSSYADVLDRLIEIPFGIDEAIFSPGESFRSHFGLSDSDNVFLFVGGMDKAHAFKGIDVLLAALQQTSQARLLLVGEGILRKDYEKIARELGVGDRCSFLGRLEPDRLIEVYRSSDALVLPSTSGAEAFGLVALEAQACGLPVIASDLPGVRTVVTHEKTGLLVPSKNGTALSKAMERLIQDQGLCTKLGQEARVQVMERFTWKKHMDKLEEVYASCCSDE